MSVDMGARGVSSRRLGRSATRVSALGLGCWTIGGPLRGSSGGPFPEGTVLGWGEVDDQQSVRAIECALANGVSLFDTADIYGAGHSERVLGKALGPKRQDVSIATKFGFAFESADRRVHSTDLSPSYLRKACADSLARLRVDWIDLYQVHVDSAPASRVHEVAETLESMCEEGCIRYFGWSTNSAEIASLLADYPHAVAIQHEMNVLRDDALMLDVCRQHRFASINRGPLAMGLLTGKFSRHTRISDDDVRATLSPGDYFERARPSRSFLEKVEQVREVLMSDGRTLAQGALAWLWSRADCTIPIPGFRTVAQVEENVAALDKGALRPEQFWEVERLLGRASQGAEAQGSRELLDGER